MEKQIQKDLTKQVALVKQQASKAVLAAEAVEIKNEKDLVKATNVLTKIRRVAQMIRQKKESITKPALEILKNTRNLFRPIEENCFQAEKIITNKMLAYNQIKELKAKKEEEKIEKKVETGKMSFEKAADKLENLNPQKTVEAKNGATQFRTIQEVIIEDEKKLPREFLMPDMVKIRKVALSGTAIPGVKVIEKKVVAVITKTPNIEFVD